VRGCLQQQEQQQQRSLPLRLPLRHQQPLPLLLIALATALAASHTNFQASAINLDLNELAREGRKSILRREDVEEELDDELSEGEVDEQFYAEAAEHDPNITDMYCEEGNFYQGMRNFNETMHSAYTIPGIIQNMTDCLRAVNTMCYTATGVLWNRYAEQCLCLFGPLKGRNATNHTHMCKFKHESCQSRHWHDGMPMRMLQKRKFVGVVSSGEACVDLVKANPHCCGSGDSTTMAFMTKVLAWGAESQACECLVGINTTRYRPGRERTFASCALVKRGKYDGKCWTKKKGR